MYLTIEINLLLL